MNHHPQPCDLIDGESSYFSRIADGFLNHKEHKEHEDRDLETSDFRLETSDFRLSEF